MCALATAGLSHGQAFYSSHLDTSDLRFDRTGGSNPDWYYEVVPFWVSQTGSYVMEMSSFQQTFDTFLHLYQGTFNPNLPLNNLLNFDDDYTGALTVLPGPFSGTGLSNNGTGSGGVQPTSRIVQTLQAGVQYWSVQTSWNTFATGTYYVGIGGAPGNGGQVNLGFVPEPATVAALGLGSLALLRRRKKSA